MDLLSNKLSSLRERLIYKGGKFVLKVYFELLDSRHTYFRNPKVNFINVYQVLIFYTMFPNTCLPNINNCLTPMHIILFILIEKV